MFDFVTDMDIIKPDIYFVNEEASQLDKRIELCKTKGIKMIVGKRTAAAGLQERSSTDMKKRMREMLKEEEGGDNKTSRSFCLVVECLQSAH